MKKVFTGEVFFALFLLSGVFKESLNFPIDLAAFFLGFTTISIAMRVYKNPFINKTSVIPIVLYGVFSLWLLLSFFYTPNLELTYSKIFKFAVLTTPAFVYPFFLFKTKESVIRFLFSIAFIASAMSLFAIPMILERGANIGFVGFNEGNYLGLTRVGSIGLVILLFMGVLNDHLKKYRLLFLVVASVVLIALIASGGRMPVIAVSIALLLTVLLSIKIDSKAIRYPRYLKKLFLTAGVLFAPLFIAYKQGFFNSLIFRFETLLATDDGGASAFGRTDRFIASINMWKENAFLGNGFGSFGQYYTNGAAHDYPHNTFLELLSEVGIIGLLIFVLLLAVASIRFVKIGRIKQIRSTNLFISISIAFVVIFINAMVSGDLNGNRILLTFLAIIFILPLIYKREISEA